MELDRRVYRLLSCSYCHCAICHTWIEKHRERTPRENPEKAEAKLPTAPEVVGFIYGDESSLEGCTGPIVLHRNRLQASVSTVSPPIKILPVEDVRRSFGKQLLEAFAFHYDCYVLLRKALQPETLAELASFVWHLAHSSQSTMPVWPVEHTARSQLWVKQIFQDRCSLRSQLDLAKTNDSEATELLEHLLNLPEEILEQISLQIPNCPWTCLAATLYVSSFSSYLRSNALCEGCINLDAELFVLHLPLFGRKYLVSIQNEPFRGSENIGHVNSNGRLMVCLDEIGILDIFVSSAIKGLHTHHDGLPKQCAIFGPVELSLRARVKKKVS